MRTSKIEFKIELTTLFRRLSAACALVGAAGILAHPIAAGAQGLGAQVNVQPTPDRVGIDQKLDQQVPLDVAFKDESGHDVKLGDYFGKHPVILVMPFYRCAGTCILEMDGLIKVANAVNYNMGKDYEIVVVSLDPRETPDLAGIKKRDYLHDYDRPGADAGLHCLTGTRESIERLANAVGFRFFYAPSGAPVHSTGLMVCTPHGKLSRYLLGVDYAPRDLNLSLVEAGENRIGSLSEKVELLCSQYDPRSGKYTVAVVRLLQVAGCGTVLLLAGYIGSMFYVERHRKAPMPTQGSAGDNT
ncbi:MAG TPA: SCO family protein [Chthonomonadaceae bacterium]|nr:SCO family protein [Chthonomonadaceae bacterium]